LSPHGGSVRVRWRVVLDEAQLVASGSSNAYAMAQLLKRCHAWGLSGTPLGAKQTSAELEGPLAFVRHGEGQSQGESGGGGEAAIGWKRGACRRVASLIGSGGGDGGGETWCDGSARSRRARGWLALRGLLRRYMWRATVADVRREVRAAEAHFPPRLRLVRFKGGLVYMLPTSLACFASSFSSSVFFLCTSSGPAAASPSRRPPRRALRARSEPRAPRHRRAPRSQRPRRTGVVCCPARRHPRQ